MAAVVHVVIALFLTVLLARRREAPSASSVVGYIMADVSVLVVGWVWFAEPRLAAPGPLGRRSLTAAVPVVDLMLVWGLIWHSRPPMTSLTLIRFMIIMASCAIAPVSLAVMALRPGPLPVRDFTVITVVMTCLLMLRLWVLSRELDERTRAMADLAGTDHLTRLPNRRTADARLQHAVVRAAGGGPVPVVAILDLDHFKAYNDVHGHQGGDRRLVEFADLWRRPDPRVELAARLGGEEFVVLSFSGADGLTAVIDARRTLLTGHDTYSAGVAAWRDGDTVPELLRRADEALYRAKDQGRGRTVTVPDVTPPHPLPVDRAGPDGTPATTR